MSTDTGPGRLTKLSLEQRLLLARLIAVSKSVKGAYRAFYEEVTDAPQYPYSTVLQYSKSKQFIEQDRALALSDIRENVEDQYLVPNADRIEELKKLFWNLSERFNEPLKIEEEVRVTGELRQLLKQIKDEAEPFTDNVTQLLSPFELFFETRKSFGTPKVPLEGSGTESGIQAVPVPADSSGDQSGE